MQGHTGAVQAVAFSPDGQHVISAGQDGTIRIWDSKSGQELASLAEHQGPVWALALTAHDHALASGGRDRLVRLRTPKTTTKIVSRQAKEQPEIQERDGETGPPPSPPPYPEARLVVQPHEVKPGHRLKIHLMVKNTGKGPLYRFQATTHSPNPLFDGQLLYFGKIDAGERKAESVAILIPEDFSSSETNIQVSFKEFNGFIPDPLQAALTISGAQRPRFAYNYQILDDGSGQSVGNGDGRIQKGEAVDLLLTLRNVGAVIAPNTWVEMTNAKGQHLKIRPHMIRFGELKPDESKQVPDEFLPFGPIGKLSNCSLKYLLKKKLNRFF